MTHGVSPVDLDGLITAALTGQPYSQLRLGRQAQAYARKLSMAWAPDLPKDQHDDVFNQAFVELFNLGPAALAQRSGKVLFRRAVRAAVRAVRASYAPPGARTRPSAKLPPDLVAAEDIGRVFDQTALDLCMTGEDDARAVDFDLIEDLRAGAAVKAFEDGHQIDALLAKAPRRFAAALRLIHLHDRPVEEVAAAAGVSRFVLHRRLTVVCAGLRLAA